MGCVGEAAGRLLLAHAQWNVESENSQIQRGGGKVQGKECALEKVKRLFTGRLSCSNGTSQAQAQLALLYIPSLQLLLYDSHSSSALCREVCARWEPDGSGTCVGTGL